MSRSKYFQRPVTLPFDVAMTLGAGDILLFRETPRLILEGPKDRPPPQIKIAGKFPAIYFCFSIHHRSWTGRANTTYLWNDIKRLARVPPKPLDVAQIGPLERQKLVDMGFDPDYELRREKAEFERVNDNIRSNGGDPGQRKSKAWKFLRVCQKISKRKV